MEEKQMAAKKENVLCNTTKETLFVGVGGIGSDIVKRVAKRCRGSEADNIRFVCMDTNQNDLRTMSDTKTKITSIQTSSPQTVLDYLKNDEDARNNWFPNNTTLYPKTVSEGAGQVRAISRLALNATIKSGKIGDLYQAIDELFLKDGGEYGQALRVVIVSSAAGGTGSGIAMTVGMLIREYLHKHYREKGVIIRGYLLLPGVMDTVISTETERESLRRNGYATLKEINAFMIKASGFCGVRKDLERYQSLSIDVPTATGGVERLEGLPFDFCFLLDRIDHSQKSMQNLTQYKEFAAQSLYEQNIGAMENKAFSTEDNIIKEFANGDNLGRNRFGGIGASVLRYPYEEIVEYVAYARAIACLGDGETVGDWIKYDKAYEKEKAEFKKKRAYTTEEAPTPGSVYIKTVNEGLSRFDNQIKGSIVHEVDKLRTEFGKKVSRYLDDFDLYISSTFEKAPNISSIKPTLDKMMNPIDYEGDESQTGQGSENLGRLRSFENEVRTGASSSAKATAKSVFYDAPSVGVETKPFHLESLLKGVEGAIHPNAMRYVLYSLFDKFTEAHKLAQIEKNSADERVREYAVNVNNPDRFDVRGGFTSKSVEVNFEGVCALEKDPSFFEKSALKKVWDKFNELFPEYCAALSSLYESTLKEASYGIAIEYIKSLCDEFEKFYSSFENKVYLMAKAQEEISDKLKFREGDNTTYVCATDKCLERWAEICPRSGDDLMLPSSLSAKIFDAVKANAASNRLAKYDPLLATPPVDIFDAVLIDFFVEDVRDSCDDILNINIISAISQENKFFEYFKACERASDGEIVFMPEISDGERTEYLRKKISFGYKLAAPGIGFSTFDEPREVRICAYNSKLDMLRDVNIPMLVQPNRIDSMATPTVSKYEMHFFNALYNVTPNMLSRFKSPEECAEDSNYNEEAGIYFRAYHEYIKNIGPDSTKCATISLHIDKRWDSLTELPEISLDAHYKEMVRIHSALIYGIILGIIVKYPSSRYDINKRVFALEGPDGDRTALIVSNNTECDEFYEILDALYRDRASVSKILERQEKACKIDIESNRRYNDSSFVRSLESFVIGDGHKAPTSIFEIPLAYYNSLPRAKLDDDELSIMIDSVILVLEQEISKYEQEVDRDPFLAKRLEEQFRLFIKNFNNDEYNEGEVMRKNTDITDNRVVNMVYRKVANKLKTLQTYQFTEKIEELRELIK